MAITEADVRKVAELARLRVEDDEIAKLTAELDVILSHMSELQNVNTASVDPVAGIGGDGTPLRPDVVNPAPMMVPGVSLSEDSRDGFIIVPRLSTHEEISE